MLAGSRRTASRRFQAAGVADDWDRFYDLLRMIGSMCEVLLVPLLREIVKRFDPGPTERWKRAIDESPTRRIGRHVEGANVHHHPTPGQAEGPWIFEYNWVCLALLTQHSNCSMIALPLL